MEEPQLKSYGHHYVRKKVIFLFEGAPNQELWPPLCTQKGYFFYLEEPQIKSYGHHYVRKKVIFLFEGAPNQKLRPPLCTQKGIFFIWRSPKSRVMGIIMHAKRLFFGGAPNL